MSPDDRILRKAAAIRLLKNIALGLEQCLIVKNGRAWDLQVMHDSPSLNPEDFGHLVDQCLRPAIAMGVDELRKKLREIVDEKDPPVTLE